MNNDIIAEIRQFEEVMTTQKQRSKVLQTTQGHDKMLRYIDDLVRNKNFKKLLKKIRNLRNRYSIPPGMYADWSPEEQKKHDRINNEVSSIIDGYEALRKRCKRLFRDKLFKIEKQIAREYGLDVGLISLAEEMSQKNKKSIELAMAHADPDMCKLTDLYDDELNPYNKGEEIIYLMPRRQVFITAYPVAIALHQRASKRDVLDYIEKKWKWIDAQMSSYYNEKGALKIRKRKHSQEMLDFIWGHQFLPAKKIEAMLDKKFPEKDGSLQNNPTYFEIRKIIQLEKERRYRNIT